MKFGIKNIVITGIFFAVAGVFFSYVFSGRTVLPQTFSAGPITLHYYGVIMAAAIAAGFYVALRRAAAFGLSSERAADVLFWCTVGGFLGARLYHVFSSFPYYIENPWAALKVWEGGLSIYGAVLGGGLALCACGRIFRLKISAGAFLDWLTPSLLAGQIIGRLGNLFNYEAFGYPTELPWKMFVPFPFRPADFRGQEFFHPWFLYEMLLNAAVLVFLCRRRRGGEGGRGGLFVTYLILYNIGRFFLEFLRIDSTFVGPFRLNALVSAGLVVAGLAVKTIFFQWKNSTPS